MDATTLIAVCALAVSVFSTALSAWTAYEQRNHMRLSVRPIAAVAMADFQDMVGVFLQNKGLGPLRMVSLRATDDRGTTHTGLISHMPSLSSGISWSNFYDVVDKATLEPGKRLDLLLLEGG